MLVSDSYKGKDDDLIMNRGVRGRPNAVAPA